MSFAVIYDAYDRVRLLKLTHIQFLCGVGQAYAHRTTPQNNAQAVCNVHQPTEIADGLLSRSPKCLQLPSYLTVRTQCGQQPS